MMERTRSHLPFAAVILDMDGVMVDSDHQWMLSEGPFLRGLLGRWGIADHRKAVGLGIPALYELLVREYGLRMGKANFLAKCETTAQDIYRHKVRLAPGLRQTIRSWRRAGLLLGLASSSPRAWVDLVLRRFRLGRLFNALATGDDTPGRTKPAPDLYLLTARRLRARPQVCLAVEDSELGVRAAKAAGMVCVGLRSGANDEQDLSRADWQERGFAGLGYRGLISRLKAAGALTKLPQPASKD